jgi:hypothetical protein
MKPLKMVSGCEQMEGKVFVDVVEGVWRMFGKGSEVR